MKSKTNEISQCLRKLKRENEEKINVMKVVLLLLVIYGLGVTRYAEWKENLLRHIHIEDEDSCRMYQCKISSLLLFIYGLGVAFILFHKK